MAFMGRGDFPSMGNDDIGGIQDNNFNDGERYGYHRL